MQHLPPSLTSKLVVLGALALGLVTAGCAGELDPSLRPQGQGGTGNSMGTAGTGGGTPPCDAVTMLLGNANKCATAGACHGPSGTQGIDMMTPGVVARLVGKMPPATSPSCSASPMPYLVANSNPPMGLLLTKLMNPPPCGSVMPFGGLGGAITPAEMTCLNDWALAAIQGRTTQ